MKVRTDVIKYRATKQNIPISRLETLAGVKAGTISNILYGRSQRPSADTMQKLAIALNCSVKDLITIGDIEDPQTGASTTIWDQELFTEAVVYITNISKSRKTGLSREKLLDLVDEACKYSQKLGRRNLDKDFTNWIVQKAIQ